MQRRLEDKKLFELGERIKEQRLKQKWTQDVLAQKIGTSKHVISNWERGVANPDCKQIVLLCKALSVSADFYSGSQICQIRITKIQSAN